MDTEPSLILDNINVFITVVAKARVEDLEVNMGRVREALKRLCKSLVDVCIYHGIEKSMVNTVPLVEYARKRGIQNPSKDDLIYIGRYIFGYDITERLASNDELILSIDYLEEIPFIRLDLMDITIRLRNDFPVERLRNKELRCHPTAIVHRLGAAAVTCWLEVPTQLTVEETNRLINALTYEQVVIEALGVPVTSTLGEFLHGLAKSLLTSLIQVLRGEEPGSEGMLREDIRRYIEDIYIVNEVLHVGGVSMVKEDGSTVPITSVEDLVKCCPRQVASLVTGFIDWRRYALDEAVRHYRKALAAIYQDELVMAGIRGVVIYLREPYEYVFLKNVNSALRDPDHERHHHSVLQSFADDLLQIYQLVGIVETVLHSYNLRIRRYPLERARLGEIERFLDLVERGLEEIDNYSLVIVDPMRTILRTALRVRGVLSRREVVERRLAHIHRVLVERASRRTSQLLLVLTFYLAVLGVYSVVQTLPAQRGMGFWLALLILVFFITITAITALTSVDLLVDLILSTVRRLRRIFRSPTKP